MPSTGASAGTKTEPAGAVAVRPGVNWRQSAWRLWPWLAAVLTGLLGVACFAPFNQPWVCWIALTPLIAAIWFSGVNSGKPWLRHLLLGYLAGIVFFTGTFGWLGSLGILFENFWLRGLSLLLSTYLAVHFALWAWFIGLIAPRDFARSGRNLLTGLLAASAWVAHEWVRGWLFSGFGWNGLGVALHAQWPLIQITEFTGVTGLSFVIVLVNVIAVTTPLRLFREAQTHRMRPHFDITLTMVGVVGLLAYGMHSVQNRRPTKPVRVATVQASVPQSEKFDPQFTGKIFSKFAHLSQIAVQSTSPQLLIWPESSMPDPVRNEDTESYRFVMDFSASAKTDLLLGTLDVEDGSDYNCALFVSGIDHQLQIYRKVHLVPFGEYVPLRHSFPLFAAVAGKWVPGDFAAGNDYTVFRLTNNDVRVAPLICFEDTIGDLTRQFVLRQANLLVNMTNDGWFLQSAGSEQHLANAIFRCVETRRPMVRAANTGITCFVNEFGRVTQTLRDEKGSTFTEGVLTGEVNVPTGGELTFYVRHGEWFAKTCAGIALIAILTKAVQMIWQRDRGGSPESPG
jgi:apolipoprotein N-acyltransferase